MPEPERVLVLGIDDHSSRQVYLVDGGGEDWQRQVLWSRKFRRIEHRDAMLTAIRDEEIDLLFLGRLAAIFGPAEIDRIVERIEAEVEQARREAKRVAVKAARQHLIVNLYARADRHGRPTLELERRSRDKPDWKIRYDRAAERDRLCDWLRWQKDRFLAFLSYAAEHGDEALARLLTDEMFETERWIKKEGRGAGGLRPLRMWRGD